MSPFSDASFLLWVSIAIAAIGYAMYVGCKMLSDK